MGTRGARTNNLCNAKKRKLSTTFQQIEFHKCSANSRNLSRTVEQNTELKKKTNNFVDIISVFGLFFFLSEYRMHHTLFTMLHASLFLRGIQTFITAMGKIEVIEIIWANWFSNIPWTQHSYFIHNRNAAARRQSVIAFDVNGILLSERAATQQQRKKKTRNRYQKHLQKIAATIMRTSVLFVCLYIGLCFLFFVRVPVSRTLLFMLNWAGLSMCVYAPHWNGVPQKLQLISPPLLHNDNQSAR